MNIFGFLVLLFSFNCSYFFACAPKEIIVSGSTEASAEPDDFDLARQDSGCDVFQEIEQGLLKFTPHDNFYFKVDTELLETPLHRVLKDGADYDVVLGLQLIPEAHFFSEILRQNLLNERPVDYARARSLCFMHLLVFRGSVELVHSSYSALLKYYDGNVGRANEVWFQYTIQADSRGRTAWHYAFMFGNEQVIQALQKGCFSNQLRILNNFCDDKGLTISDYAFEFHGWTLAHIAAFLVHRCLVEELIVYIQQKGMADLFTVQDRKRSDPCALARKLKNRVALDLLSQAKEALYPFK